MSNQVPGTLHLKGETQIVSDKFTKRDFVIVTDDQYPQYISFQLTQDKVSLLDKANVGDSVMVNFNLRGREWTAPDGKVKYFNTLECWSLSVNPNDKPTANLTAAPPLSEHVPDKAGTSDDLPF